jgi:hypothetical protein
MAGKFRRSTPEERQAAARRIAREVANGRMTREEGLRRAAELGTAYGQRDNAITAATVAGLAFVALVVAGLLVWAYPSAGAVVGGQTCRWCPDLRCVSSSICGAGCSCIKVGSESTGRCVSVAAR